MSLRTLIEINHDVPEGDPATFLLRLRHYINSASSEHAKALEPYGFKVLGMRHHSGQFILDGEPDGFPVQHTSKGSL